MTYWSDNPIAQTPTPEGPFISVSGGRDHTCGVRDDGSVTCWGDDRFGQASPPAGGFTSVSAGELQVCAVKDNKSLACWGNAEINMPQGIFTSVSAGGHLAPRQWNPSACTQEPCPTLAPPPPFEHISHTCGVRDDGSIVCWGDDAYGQASPPKGTFISVSAGGNHTCGVRANGSVACWGNDFHGQSRPPPMAFISVSSGGGNGTAWPTDLVDAAHTCGLRDDYSIACWGHNVLAKPPA